MKQVALHGFWESPFSHRVIWTLKLKGVDYEYIEEDFPNKSRELLQYNPVHEKIPVLVHRGRAIAESTVILEYIEETWPENPLMPAAEYERAVARFWIKFGQDKGPILHSFFRTVDKEQENAVENALQVLRVVEEQALGERKFFNGDSIGLVDISFGWLALWYECLEQVAGKKLIEPTTLPRLYEWIKNFKEVAVVKQNLPDRERLLAYMRVRREMFIS